MSRVCQVLNHWKLKILKVKVCPTTGLNNYPAEDTFRALSFDSSKPRVKHIEKRELQAKFRIMGIRVLQAMTAMIIIFFDSSTGVVWWIVTKGRDTFDAGSQIWSWTGPLNGGTSFSSVTCYSCYLLHLTILIQYIYHLSYLPPILPFDHCCIVAFGVWKGISLLQPDQIHCRSH